jgi:hypothetical protein
MSGLRRSELLSELERYRLTNRNSLDTHTRFANDHRVLKKAGSFLENIEDFRCILKYIKTERVAKTILTDSNIDQIKILLFEIKRYREFFDDGTGGKI